MSFDVDVTRKLGAKRISVRFTAPSGITALVGPSGIGKTSVLNMIAGLLRPDHGHVEAGGCLLFDSNRRIDLSAADRRSGYVFQDRRLFPHMRVGANLRYGRRGPGLIDIDLMVDMLGIADLLDRWPATLSGGEAQRVAIGRALLSSPHFLLLDEPLASLDEARRAPLRAIIRRVSQELALPILLVSHDSSDVDQLADTIVRMDAKPSG